MCRSAQVPKPLEVDDLCGHQIDSLQRFQNLTFGSVRSAKLRLRRFAFTAAGLHAAMGLAGLLADSKFRFSRGRELLAFDHMNRHMYRNTI